MVHNLVFFLGCFCCTAHNRFLFMNLKWKHFFFVANEHKCLTKLNVFVALWYVCALALFIVTLAYECEMFGMMIINVRCVVLLRCATHTLETDFFSDSERQNSLQRRDRAVRVNYMANIFCGIFVINDLRTKDARDEHRNSPICRVLYSNFISGSTWVTKDGSRCITMALPFQRYNMSQR